MICRICFLLLILAVAGSSGSSAQIPTLDWPIENVSEGHGFTEGASLAPDGTIFFSDMDHNRILQFDPGSGHTKVWLNKSGKTNGLYILNNNLYGCEAEGRAVVQYDLAKGPGSRKVLAGTFQGDRLGCPNDLTVIGNTMFFSEFWIEGIHSETGELREIFNNRVYQLSLKTLKLDSLEFTFETPNGVASSPDGRLLFVGDIDANKLYRAQVKKGRPGELETLADLDELDLSGPDGMAVSGDGRIFLALFKSDKLLVLTPDGNPVGTLPTGPLTSNCFFAADGKTLYITADKKLKRVIIP